MMEKHFMIDIEATGIDPAMEDLLSVGVLEVEFDGSFWQPKNAGEWFCHTTRKPESQFAKEHMVELYERCNALPSAPPYKRHQTMRDCLLNFIRSCGTTGAIDTYFMGWNASNFDLPFLVAKGILQTNRYETGPDGKDRMVGDFHYRVYELGGAVSLAQNVCSKMDRGALLEVARGMAPRIFPAQGKKHDALYDCYTQLQLLNGLIALMRSVR